MITNEFIKVSCEIELSRGDKFSSPKLIVLTDCTLDE